MATEAARALDSRKSRARASLEARKSLTLMIRFSSPPRVVSPHLAPPTGVAPRRLRRRRGRPASRSNLHSQVNGLTSRQSGPHMGRQVATGRTRRLSPRCRNVRRRRRRRRRRRPPARGGGGLGEGAEGPGPPFTTSGPTTRGPALDPPQTTQHQDVGTSGLCLPFNSSLIPSPDPWVSLNRP